MIRTGNPHCVICLGYGYYVYDVPVTDLRFGKAQKCECWRMPKIKETDPIYTDTPRRDGRYSGAGGAA